MPVHFDEYEENKQRFSLSKGSNARKIIELLSDHPETGFTPKEIHQETGVPRGSVGTTLNRLKDRQLVRHKEPFWAIGDDDRLALYAGMKLSFDAIEDRYESPDMDEWAEYAEDPRDHR